MTWFSRIEKDSLGILMSSTDTMSPFPSPEGRSSALAGMISPVRLVSTILPSPARRLSTRTNTSKPRTLTGAFRQTSRLDTEAQAS
jgi:hypothetical protein